MEIPYARQSIDQDDVEAVVRVLRSDRLTQGPAVDDFERDFAAACSVPFAVAFSSGTAALHAAAFAAGVGPGKDLITSALTFLASANCGAYLGARPRFADIDSRTWNVNEKTISKLVTGDTACVVPVHFAGLPAPVDEIRAMLPDGVRIIEDAAHALGARLAGEPIGSCIHSDMAAFSFHPVKAIAAGEGGMVTTRDAELDLKLREFRNHGISTASHDSARQGAWYREQHELGFNYRLSDIHAALGRSQLSKLEVFIGQRNAVAERYRAWLADVEELELPPAAPVGDLHAYHLFVVRHRDGADARRRLFDGLRERGVFAQVHYIPVHLNPWYGEKFGYGPGLCPAAEKYYAGCLSLPCFPGLSIADQRLVVKAVCEALQP